MAVVANKPDIVCIVEYWLCGYISANEVALPGYQVYMSVTKLDNEAVYIAIVSCEERRDSDDIKPCRSIMEAFPLKPHVCVL